MRRHPSSWDNVLAALGFRRRVRKVGKEFRRRNSAWVESLERREMLAADTLQVIRPAYEIVGDGDAPTSFVVSTEYDAQGRASALVEYTPEALANPGEVNSIHELTLELRLGDQVLETQEIVVSPANQDFRAAFYGDRLDAALTDVRQVDEETLSAWADELTPAGVFPSIESGTQFPNDESRLLESAARLAAIAGSGRHEVPPLVDPARREAFYAAVNRVVGQSVGLSDEGFAVVVEDLGRVALLAGEVLAEDLSGAPSSAEASPLAGLAGQTRDALLGVVSPYYTVLGVYGTDTDLRREETGSSGGSALTVVEDGDFTLGDRLRLELGEFEAFVGATITPTATGLALAASSLSLSGPLHVEDGAYSASGFSATGDTLTVGPASEGRLRIDLASERGQVPESAVLRLTGASGDASTVRLESHRDAWGQTDRLLGAWGEGDSWGEGVAPTETSPGSGVFEFDVTEAVQRSLLLGDANADGVLAHYVDYWTDPFLDAEVDAIYLAIRDWAAYEAKYGGLHGSAGELVYRVDADGDGVANPSDGPLLLEKMGLSPADFDLNGAVTIHDLSLYQANYGKAVQSFRQGDADFNGVVNEADDAIWRRDENRTYTQFHDAAPTFRLSSSDGGGVVEFASSEAASGVPTLDLTYGAAELQVVDVHARSGQPLTVRVRAVNGSVAADAATVQLMRIPASGAPAELIGSSKLISQGLSVGAQTSVTFAPGEISGLQQGDRVAAVVRGDGYESTRELSAGVFRDAAGVVRVVDGDSDSRVEAFYANQVFLIGRSSYGDLSWSADGSDAPTGFEFHLGGGDDVVLYRDEWAVPVYFDGGAGDDTFHLTVSTDAVPAFEPLAEVPRPITFADTRGVNRLTRGVSSSYVITGEPGPGSIDPASDQPQPLSYTIHNPGTGQTVSRTWEVSLVSPHALAEAPWAALASLERITVDELSDLDDDDFGPGKLSLREALRIAETLPGKQTIEFAPGLFADGPQTITLTSGATGASEFAGAGDRYNAPRQLPLSSEVQINGPGADLLTLSGAGATRVFAVSTELPVGLSDLTIADGYVAGTGAGAGLDAGRGDLTIERTVWRGNEAHLGGAIYAYKADVVIRDSVFEGNEAYRGGAVYVRPDTGESTVIERSLLSDNRAHTGSALEVYSWTSTAGTVSLDTVTVSGNHAQRAAAVRIVGNKTSSQLDVDITNSTIARNQVDWSNQGGAGIFDNTSGVVSIQSTIVSENEEVDYWFRRTRGASVNNLIGRTLGSVGGVTGWLPAPNQLNVHNAGLLPLVDNGGPTRTHALAPDSPAIDQGAGATQETDQRGEGYARQIGSQIDVGAFEALTRVENDVLVLEGTAGDDELIVGPGFLYVGGLGGERIAYERDGRTLVVRGLAGNDRISLLPGVDNVILDGGADDDQLFGSSGNDHLIGGDGDDRLYGRGGRDHLEGDGGDDILYGGDGDDGGADNSGLNKVYGLFGGDGNDTIFGGQGTDDLVGGAGNDHLDGGADSDALYGGAGADVLYGGESSEGSDTYYGDRDSANVAPGVEAFDADRFVIPEVVGDHRVHSDDTLDTLDFSAWSHGVTVDLSVAENQNQELAPGAKLWLHGAAGLSAIGTAYNDTLIGDAAANVLDGRGGDDTLVGGGGSDELIGGLGNDTLLGTDGLVTLNGGSGDDAYQITTALDPTVATTLSVRDSAGVDRIEALDAGWNVAYGLSVHLGESTPYLALTGEGAPALTLDLPAGGVIENVTGSPGADLLVGGDGVNTLDGQGSDDRLFGGAEDTILGGDGLDSIEARPARGQDGLGYNGGRVVLGAGDDPQDWTFANLPAGEYRVLATWDAIAGAAIAYDLKVDTTTLQSVTTPQGVTPVGDEAAGRVWQPIGDLVRVEAGEALRVTGSRASTVTGAIAIADGVRVERVSRPLTISVTPDPTDAERVTVAATGGISGVSFEVSGEAELLADGVTIVANEGLAPGYYPIEITATDGEGNVGVETHVLTVGSPPAAPDIMVEMVDGAGVVNATENAPHSLTFTVTGNAAQVDLVGDLPPGLIHVTPDVVGQEHTFAWTPGEGDIGEYNFSVRATTGDATPLQRLEQVNLVVADANTPASMTPGSLQLINTPPNAGTSPELHDPSIRLTVENDGDFEDVRIEVDWTYDGATFAPGTVVYGRDASDGAVGEWLATIRPSADDLRDIDLMAGPAAATKVAVRIVEVDPDTKTDLENHTPVVESLDYTPVEAPGVSISGSGPYEVLAAPAPASTVTYSASSFRVRGSVDNPGGREGDLRVRFYYGAGASEADQFLGVTETDASGAFEFTPRDAFDLSEIAPASQVVRLRAVVEDPSPLAAENSSAEAEWVLELVKAEPPVFANTVYSNGLELDGYGLVHRPRLSGYLYATSDLTEEATDTLVAIYDAPTNGTLIGHALTDEKGHFEYYLPDGTPGAIHAEPVVWDEFRRRDVPVTMRHDVTATGSPDVVSLPGVTIASPTERGGRVTVTGSVADAIGVGIAGAVIELAVTPQGVAAPIAPTGDPVLVDTDDLVATTVAVTGVGGKFEIELDPLPHDATYDLHARVLGWNASAAAGAEEHYGVFSTASVTVGSAPAAPEITLFDLKFDTGDTSLAGEQRRTSNTTVEGVVTYDGDLTQVEVALAFRTVDPLDPSEDLFSGDVSADAIVFPDEQGRFSYRVEGLDPNEVVAVQAWTILREVNPFVELEGPFKEQEDALVNAYNSGQLDDLGVPTSDFGAQEWLDGLFGETPELGERGELGGEWLGADFEPGPASFAESARVEARFTFDPTQAASFSHEGLVRLGAASEPTFQATLRGAGAAPGRGQLLDTEVAIYVGDTLDGIGETDSEGVLLYTLAEHAIGDGMVRLAVATDASGDPPAEWDAGATGWVAVGGVIDLPTAVWQTDEMSPPSEPLDGIELTLTKESDRRLEIRGRVADVDTGSQVSDNPAGHLALLTVVDTVTGAVLAEGRASTNGVGEFVHRFSGIEAEPDAQLTVHARLADWRYSDVTGRTYLVRDSKGVSLTWDDPFERASITRFELANDTGRFENDPSVRLLDRVTADPTVTGLAKEAAPYSVIEFARTDVATGVRVVDGTATTDAYGRFTYQPSGLSYGSWNLEARVRSEVLAQLETDDWVSLPASGGVGFRLVAPSTPEIESLDFAAPVTGMEVQHDPRLRVVVADSDSLDGLSVDFYRVDNGVYLGTTPVDPVSGAAEFVPPLIESGASVRAVPWKLDPLTGERVVGAASANVDASVTTYSGGSFSVGSVELLHGDDNLKRLAPTLIGRVGVPTDTADVPEPSNGQSNLPPLPDRSVKYDRVTPFYVEIEATYWVGNTPVGVTYDRAPVGDGELNGSGNRRDYRFAYDPDLSRWPDGFDTSTNGLVTFRFRPVGADDSGWVVGGLNGNAVQISAFGRPSTAAQGVELFLDAPLASGVIDALPSVDPDQQPTGQPAPLQQTVIPRVVGSVEQSLAGDADALAGGESGDWRDSVRVVSRWLEIDYPDSNGVFDGIADLVAPIDDANDFAIDLVGLPYGDAGFRSRLVEEVYVDHDFGGAYEDAYESTRAVAVRGDWAEHAFTHLDPRPTVAFESVGGQAVVDASGVAVPDLNTTDPTIVGSVDSELIRVIREVEAATAGAPTTANGVEPLGDLGGLLVEFDHNGDGLVDGSTVTYANGEYEYVPQGLTDGVVTLRVRASDPYADTGDGSRGVTGAWRELEFDYQEVAAPTAALVGLDTLPTTTGGAFRFDAAALSGVVTADATLTDLEVEFDFDGDGIVDDRSTVEAGLAETIAASSGAAEQSEYPFEYAAIALPLGAVSLRVRATGRRGVETFVGEWGTSVELFNATGVTPATTATLADPVTVEVVGRVTVGGYGYATTIEVRTAGAGNADEHVDRFVTERDGSFRVTPTQLRRGPGATQTLWVRGVDYDGVAGEWTAVDLSAAGLAAPGGFTSSVSGVDSFGAAHPEAGGGDPTLAGQLTGLPGADFSRVRARVTVTPVGGAEAVFTAELPVGSDGSFRVTPTLDPSQGGAYEAKLEWLEWDPYAGAIDVSAEHLAGFTYAPTAGQLPAVLTLVETTPAGAPVPTFRGTLDGPEARAGVVVSIDTNGDGVADDTTVAYDDPATGEVAFTYASFELGASAAAQTLTAWVASPEYRSVPDGVSRSVDFTQTRGGADTDGPRVRDLALTPTQQNVFGRVETPPGGTAVVEYHLSWDGVDGVSEVVSGELAAGAGGHFLLDVTAAPAGVATLRTRGVVTDSGGVTTAGPWETLRFNRTSLVDSEAGGLSVSGLSVVEAVGATGAGDPPTHAAVVSGQLGRAAGFTRTEFAGAFTAVEAEVQVGVDDLGAAVFAVAGRATADATGAFRFDFNETAEGGLALGAHTVRFTPVGWDAAAGAEVRGATSAAFTFELVAAAPQFDGALVWDSAAGEVTGRVAGVRRLGGVRVEFTHAAVDTTGGGQSGDPPVDGFAYTDATGAFRYRPLGLDPVATGDTVLTARVVTVDAETGESSAPAFGEAASAAVAPVTVTAGSNVAQDVSLDGVSDLSNDELARAALRDAVAAALGHAGLLGAPAPGDDPAGVTRLDVGFGDIALLHHGGGEQEGGLGGDVFVPAPTTSFTMTAAPAPLANLATPDSGRLTGAYDYTHAFAANGDLLVRFTLTIDSYEAAWRERGAETDAGEALGGDALRETTLELEGEYVFEFAVASDGVTFNGALTRLDHHTRESVDYDYTLTERAYAEGVGADGVGAGGASGASEYVATGGSQYVVTVGSAAAPAVYQAGVNGGPATYTGEIAVSQTRVVSDDGSAAGHGGATGHGGSGAGGPSTDPTGGDTGGTTETNGGTTTTNSTPGVTVDRTYTETVTKTGRFDGDLGSATGTITVTSSETVVTTRASSSRISGEREESESSSRVVTTQQRHYQGSATYTDGVSLTGRGTLEESTSVVYVYAGSGRTSRSRDLGFSTGSPENPTVLKPAEQSSSESWSYAGEGSSYSTVTITGAWVDSLSGGDSTSRVEVTYDYGYSDEGEGTWSADEEGALRTSRFGGAYRSRSSARGSGGFEGGTRTTAGGELSSTVTGESTRSASGATQEVWGGGYDERSFGPASQAPGPGVREATEGVSVSVRGRSGGEGSGDESSRFSYQTGPGGVIDSETTDYAFRGVGWTDQAVQVRGGERLESGERGVYLDRLATGASYTIAAEGVQVTGPGSEGPGSAGSSSLVETGSDAYARGSRSWSVPGATETTVWQGSETVNELAARDADGVSGFRDSTQSDSTRTLDRERVSYAEGAEAEVPTLDALGVDGFFGLEGGGEEGTGGERTEYVAYSQPVGGELSFDSSYEESRSASYQESDRETLDDQNDSGRDAWGSSQLLSVGGFSSSGGSYGVTERQNNSGGSSDSRSSSEGGGAVRSSSSRESERQQEDSTTTVAGPSTTTSGTLTARQEGESESSNSSSFEVGGTTYTGWSNRANTSEAQRTVSGSVRSEAGEQSGSVSAEDEGEGSRDVGSGGSVTGSGFGGSWSTVTDGEGDGNSGARVDAGSGEAEGTGWKDGNEAKVTTSNSSYDGSDRSEFSSTTTGTRSGGGADADNGSASEGTHSKSSGSSNRTEVTGGPSARTVTKTGTKHEGEGRTGRKATIEDGALKDRSSSQSGKGENTINRDRTTTSGIGFDKRNDEYKTTTQGDTSTDRDEWDTQSDHTVSGGERKSNGDGFRTESETRAEENDSAHRAGDSFFREETTSTTHSGYDNPPPSSGTSDYPNFLETITTETNWTEVEWDYDWTSGHGNGDDGAEGGSFRSSGKSKTTTGYDSVEDHRSRNDSTGDKGESLTIIQNSSWTEATRGGSGSYNDSEGKSTGSEERGSNTRSGSREWRSDFVQDDYTGTLDSGVYLELRTSEGDGSSSLLIARNGSIRVYDLIGGVEQAFDNITDFEHDAQVDAGGKRTGTEKVDDIKYNPNINQPVNHKYTRDLETGDYSNCAGDHQNLCPSGDSSGESGGSGEPAPPPGRVMAEQRRAARHGKPIKRHGVQVNRVTGQDVLDGIGDFFTVVKAALDGAKDDLTAPLAGAINSAAAGTALEDAQALGQGLANAALDLPGTANAIAEGVAEDIKDFQEEETVAGKAHTLGGLFSNFIPGLGPLLFSQRTSRVLKAADKLQADDLAKEAAEEAAEAARKQAGFAGADAGDYAKGAPEGIVYKRIDLNGEILPYIGQTKNGERFLARQAEHARKHPDAEFKFEIVDRANPGDALDIAEHNALQELTGGQKAKNSPNVSNLKDPVGPKRRPGFGLPEPRD